MDKSTTEFRLQAFTEADLTRNRVLLYIQQWDGYNLTWLDYANEVRLFLTDYKYEAKDGSVRFKVIEFVESFFRIIVKVLGSWAQSSVNSAAHCSLNRKLNGLHRRIR